MIYRTFIFMKIPQDTFDINGTQQLCRLLTYNDKTILGYYFTFFISFLSRCKD